MHKAILLRELGLMSTRQYKRIAFIESLTPLKKEGKFYFSNGSINLLNKMLDDELLETYLNIDNLFSISQLNKFQVAVHFTAPLLRKLLNHVQSKYNIAPPQILSDLDDKEINVLLKILKNPYLSNKVNAFYLQAIYASQNHFKNAADEFPEIVNRFHLHDSLSTLSMPSLTE